MLKALRGDGFSVTLYERRHRVGGLWAYSENPAHTTALPGMLHSLRRGAIAIASTCLAEDVDAAQQDMDQQRCPVPIRASLTPPSHPGKPQQIHLRLFRLPHPRQ